MTGLGDITIEFSDALAEKISKLSDQVEQARQQLITEDRIRQIVREELAVWEKRQIQAIRVHQPIRYEVK